jgi:hypothetical protein
VDLGVFGLKETGLSSRVLNLKLLVALGFLVSCKASDGGFRGSNSVQAPSPAPVIAPAAPIQNPVVVPPVAPVIPPEAVTKGSFSAWTEPKDPSPREDYRIVIQVTLPSNTTSYSENDLSGLVIGTDNYRQPLGSAVSSSVGVIVGSNNYKRYFESGVFKYSGTSATLSVLVPGAANLVQDTIQIKSNLLNESQELKIVF